MANILISDAEKTFILHGVEVRIPSIWISTESLIWNEFLAARMIYATMAGLVVITDRWKSKREL